MQPMADQAFETVGRRNIYDYTGVQLMSLNTLYQLMAAKKGSNDTLKKAKHLMLIADLISYHLCGEIFAEYSLASTTQLMDMRTGQWSKAIFDQFDLPIEKMPKVVAPGTVVGKLTEPVYRNHHLQTRGSPQQLYSNIRPQCSGQSSECKGPGNGRRVNA